MHFNPAQLESLRPQLNSAYKAVQTTIWEVSTLAGAVYSQRSGAEEVIIHTTPIPALLKLCCAVDKATLCKYRVTSPEKVCSQDHHPPLPHPHPKKPERLVANFFHRQQYVRCCVSCQRPRAKQWVPPAQTLLQALNPPVQRINSLTENCLLSGTDCLALCLQKKITVSKQWF